MKVVAIIGTYRKGKVVDQTVGHILEGAKAAGAEVESFYLIDQDISFCDNCRVCCQEEGTERGFCAKSDGEKHQDDMGKILDAIKEADSIVFASPMNAFQVTAVTKRFIERMLPLYYWPWGKMAPSLRDKKRNKRAVVVTSSAMPALMGRIFTPVIRVLRESVKSFGAKQTKTLYVGMVAGSRDYQLSPRVIARAQRLGKWLTQGGKAAN